MFCILLIMQPIILSMLLRPLQALTYHNKTPTFFSIYSMDRINDGQRWLDGSRPSLCRYITLQLMTYHSQHIIIVFVSLLGQSEQKYMIQLLCGPRNTLMCTRMVWSKGKFITTTKLLPTAKFYYSQTTLGLSPELSDCGDNSADSPRVDVDDHRQWRVSVIAIVAIGK